MEKDEQTENQNLKESIKYLATLLESISVLDKVCSKGTMVSFELKGEQYMLNLLAEGNGVKLMSMPWIELDTKGPAFSSFIRIAEEARSLYFGSYEICFFKSHDGDKTLVFSLLILDGPVAEISKKQLNKAISGMVIMKEWILSHFIAEVEQQTSEN